MMRPAAAAAVLSHLFLLLLTSSALLLPAYAAPAQQVQPQQPVLSVPIVTPVPSTLPTISTPYNQPLTLGANPYAALANMGIYAHGPSSAAETLRFQHELLSQLGLTPSVQLVHPEMFARLTPQQMAAEIGQQQEVITNMEMQNPLLAQLNQQQHAQRQQAMAQAQAQAQPQPQVQPLGLGAAPMIQNGITQQQHSAAEPQVSMQMGAAPLGVPPTYAAVPTPPLSQVSAQVPTQPSMQQFPLGYTGAAMQPTIGQQSQMMQLQQLHQQLQQQQWQQQLEAQRIAAEKTQLAAQQQALIQQQQQLGNALAAQQPQFQPQPQFPLGQLLTQPQQLTFVPPSAAAPVPSPPFGAGSPFGNVNGNSPFPAPISNSAVAAPSLPSVDLPNINPAQVMNLMSNPRGSLQAVAAMMRAAPPSNLNLGLPPAPSAPGSPMTSSSTIDPSKLTTPPRPRPESCSDNDYECQFYKSCYSCYEDHSLPYCGACLNLLQCGGDKPCQMIRAKDVCVQVAQTSEPKPKACQLLGL